MGGNAVPLLVVVVVVVVVENEGGVPPPDFCWWLDCVGSHIRELLDTIQSVRNVDLGRIMAVAVRIHGGGDYLWSL
jgi:hypothetical protein